MTSATAFSYAQAAKGQSAPPSKPGSDTAAPSPDASPAADWSGASQDVAPAAAAAAEHTDSAKPDTMAPDDVKLSLSAASSVTSPEAGNSSASTTKDDDGSSVNNAAPSDSTWESKSQTSETTKTGDSKKSKNNKSPANDETPKERKPAKPKLQDAPPPAVNFWAQRAQTMQSKPAAAPPPRHSTDAPPPHHKKDATKPEPKKKSSAPAAHNPETKPATARAERNNNPRQAPEGPADASRRNPSHRQGAAAAAAAAAAASPAPPTSEVAWPSMETAREEERKRAQEKEDKTDKEQSQVPASKTHKSEWTKMPYVPNAIFETTLPTRGGGSRGGRAGTRGPSHASARNGGPGSSGERSAARAHSAPNDDGPAKEQTDKADREAMPPPSKSSRAVNESQWKDAQVFQPRAFQNHDAQKTPVEHTHPNAAPAETSGASDANATATATATATAASAAPRGQGPTKRTRSPKKHDGHGRRAEGGDANARRGSVASRAGGEAATATATATANQQADGQSPKEAQSDRRGESRTLDNAPHHREAKGKRGRGGHRGFANGHYQPAQHASNGYAADFYGPPYAAQSQYPSQRGGHFSHNGRNGFRGPAMRSQSIPMDNNNFGRIPGGYPAYPVQMMPPYGPVPEYYASYPATMPYQPGVEQASVIPALIKQLDYYFSIENMIKDVWFRSHMDSQGYVFLSLVADFKRVKFMTTDYDLIKFACLQSTSIQLRTGEDGKDRLRANEWKQWVLPMSEREPSAQNDGPSRVERPALPQLRVFDQSPAGHGPPPPAGAFDRRFTEGPYSASALPAAFYPSGLEPAFGDGAGFDEFRGRQIQSPTKEHDLAHIARGSSASAADMDGEADTFPTDQAINLTVVVRKQQVAGSTRAPYHSSGSRTYSDGSIDPKSILEEMGQAKDAHAHAQANGEAAANGESPQANGAVSPSPVQATSPGSGAEPICLFWVKDRDAPVDSLPDDSTHELYSHLRTKALSQREHAATGTCPYDLDVLYQFWSHFLIRNFNSHMYAEFRYLADQDAMMRHNTVGLNNLLKYYSESLGSQITIRDRVARDYVEHVQAEHPAGDRSAFKQLRSAWRNGALNLKNRKKFSDTLDRLSPILKDELES